MVKKRFISGAVCPHCEARDTIVLLMDQREQIECVNCGYHDVRPTAEQLAEQQATPAQPDDMGVVTFKPFTSS